MFSTNTDTNLWLITALPTHLLVARLISTSDEHLPRRARVLLGRNGRSSPAFTAHTCRRCLYR